MRNPRVGLVGMSIALAAQVAAAQPYEGPIVDVHVHAYSRLLAPTRLCFPQPCEGKASRLTDGAELLPATLSAMEQNRVVLGVLHGGRQNVRQWVAEAPGRFIPGVQFRDPAGLSEPLRTLILADSLEVVGEILAQYDHIPAEDPRLDSIFALAHELGVPVHIHHLGLGPTQDFPIELGDPRLLSGVLGCPMSE